MVKPEYRTMHRRGSAIFDMPQAMIDSVEATVKALLHASRDCLRNQGVDTTRVRFDCRDGYYGEAFGIFRGLEILGYGYVSGPVNIGGKRDRGTELDEANFKWWFSNLEDEVLEEEGYNTDGTCRYCYDKHGKDDASMVAAGKLPAVKVDDSISTAESIRAHFGMQKPEVLS